MNENDNYGGYGPYGSYYDNLKTPLMLASISGDVEAVKYFLDSEENPNTVIHNFTALSCACCYGFSNIVEILLPITTNYVNTIQVACINNITEIIDTFFNYLGNSNALFFKNYNFFKSCFESCCERGTYENFKCFMNNIQHREIKVDQNFYSSGFINSVKFNRIEILSELFMYSNVNIQDDNGNTPLMISVIFRSYLCIEFLCGFSDLKIRNNKGDNVFSLVQKIEDNSFFKKYIPDCLKFLSENSKACELRKIVF